MPTFSNYIYANTAADAQALTGLATGQLVATGGYHTVGDGGGFLYRFATTRSDAGRKDELAVTAGGFLAPMGDLLVVNPMRWGVKQGPQSDNSNTSRIDDVLAYLLDTAGARTDGYGGIIAFPPGRFELNINLNAVSNMRSVAIVGAGRGPTVLKNRGSELAKPVIYRERTISGHAILSLQNLRVWAQGEVQGAAVSLGSNGPGNGRVWGSLRDVLLVHDSRAQPVLEIFAGIEMVLDKVTTDEGGVGLLLEEGTSCQVNSFHATHAASGIWILRGGQHLLSTPRIENDHGLNGYTRGTPFDDIKTYGLRITDSGMNQVIGFGEEGGDNVEWGLVVEGSATDPLNVTGQYGATTSNRIVGSAFNRPRVYQTGQARGSILVRGHVHRLSVDARVVNASQTQPPPGNPLYPTVRISGWQAPASGDAPYPTDIHIEGVDDKDFGDIAPVFEIAPQARAVRIRSFWFKKGRWMTAGEVKHLTAGYTLKPVESGFGFSNQGATTVVTIALPAADPGLEYQFFSVSGQVLRVDPTSTQEIRGGGPGKYLELTAGATATLKCVVPGIWEIAAAYGTLVREP